MPPPAPCAHRKRTGASAGPLVRNFGIQSRFPWVRIWVIRAFSRESSVYLSSCGNSTKPLFRLRCAPQATSCEGILALSPERKQNTGEAEGECTVQLVRSVSSRVVAPRVALFSRLALPAYPLSRRSGVAHGLVRRPPATDRVQCVEFVRGVCVSGSASSVVASGVVAFASREYRVSVRWQSPKSLLAPALLATRQAVSAQKRTRIAERLASLAAGRARQQVQ